MIPERNDNFVDADVETLSEIKCIVKEIKKNLRYGLEV